MKRALIVTSIILGLASCKSPRKEAEALDKKFHEYWKNRTSLDITKAHELDESYKSFFAKYPTDTILPGLLYQDAQLNVTCLQDNKEAIKLLNKILTDFPKHRRTPEILFFEGFIYENNLKDTTSAINRYGRIVQEYPAHPLSKQAEFCIKSIRNPNMQLAN